MFEVIVYKKFEKDIKNFHPNVKNRIKELIFDLSQNPVPREKFDIAKIEGTDSYYRCRITYSRTIYEVLWGQKIVKILKVERRDEHTYKKL